MGSKEDNINHIISLIKNQERINKDNVINVLIKIMIVIQKDIKSEGEYKKEIALGVLNKLIKDSDIEDKEVLLLFVEAYVPSVIDSLISISKRKVVIVQNLKSFCC
jgi:hypothetical protein